MCLRFVPVYGFASSITVFDAHLLLSFALMICKLARAITSRIWLDSAAPRWWPLWQAMQWATCTFQAWKLLV